MGGAVYETRMTKFIQITGLPRSGTAFLSVLFTHVKDAQVFHELAATDNDWRLQHSQSMHSPRGVVIDCSTYGYLPKAIIPDARKVFIRQPWEESLQRAIKAFGFTPPAEGFRALAKMSDQWAEQWMPLIVDRENLFKIESLRLIWDYCLEGAQEFPEAAAAHLLLMNVQRQNGAEIFNEKAMIGREYEFI